MIKAILILTLLMGSIAIGDPSPSNVCITTPTVYARDISRTYEMGDWKHYIEHLVPPGDRYLHVGHLYYSGREVRDASNYNDYMVTPWGKIYWMGKTRATRYGPQGWMRTPNSRFPIGQELSPVEDGYDFTAED